MKNLLLLALAITPLAGCVPSLGVNFKHPRADQLVLGQTSPSDVTGLLGTPTKREISTPTPPSAEAKANRTDLDAAYTGQTTTFLDFSFTKGVEHREIAFIFADDKLASYIFLSNFAEDSSDYDDNKVALLKKGVTTEAEAIAYFGPPLGRREFPQVRDMGTHAFSYNYGAKLPARGGKELDLLFDKNGILQDFKYKTTIVSTS